MFGFTESRLDYRISDDSVHIPEYTVIRRDAQAPGQTGIAVYVHSSIEHCVYRRQNFESESVECIWLEVQPTEHTSPFFVCYVYRNPASNDEWFDSFVCMLDKVSTYKNNVDLLLLGDFNIDMLKQHSSWDSTLNLFGLTQLVSSPTRITETSSTLIDHIYTNNPHTISSTRVSDLSVSDHNPISCTKTLKLPKLKPKEHTFISFRSFKHFNQASYFNDLANAPFESVYAYTDPDKALSLWYEIFYAVINKHAPIRHRRVKRPKLPPWLTTEIKEAMSHRDTLKSNKSHEEYKKARNKVKNMVRNAKRAYFNKLINNQKNTSTIWRALNAFTKKSSTHTDIPNHITADMFNEHFLSIAEKLTASNIPRDPKYTCPHKLFEFCQQKNKTGDIFNIPHMGIHEVEQYIKNMQNKTSSGPDNISSNILKLSLPYIVESLTYIYNLCISQNTFPTQLKQAKVIPIPKTKDRNNLHNYRPISLLSFLSKPLEKHVHKHLTDFMEKHSLFHPLQSGFRRNHSCSTALANMTNSWISAANCTNLSGVVFLDLTKAFDLIDHNILLHKLHIYLKNSPALPFFQSYLMNRVQRVYAHSSFSPEGKVSYGVPQGSVLGPILFCIYINDLPLHITSDAVNCHMLADDTTLSTSGKNICDITNPLQLSISEISKWCDENNMQINPTKSKSMILATRQKHQLSNLSLDLSLNNTPVEQVSDHRILGLCVDKNLRWDVHTDYVCKKVSKNVFLFHKLSTIINLEAKHLFYNAHIKSHIDYASIVWDGCSEHLLKRLNSLQRRAVKLVVPDSSLTTDEKLKQAGILSLKNQFTYNKTLQIFKIIQGHAPHYLINLFHTSQTRYVNSRHNLHLPMPRLDIFKTSITYSGAYLWNNLPSSIKACTTLSNFKRNLHKHLLLNCQT